MGKITTIGEGSGYFQPDTLFLNIEFFHRAKTNSEAIQHVHIECEKFLESISKAKVNLDDVTLEKDRIDYTNSNGELEYEVFRKIELKLPLSAVCNNALLKYLQSKNLSVSYNASYVLTDKTDIHKKLLEQAVKASREKAETIASMTNSTITGFESIDRVISLAKSVCVESDSDFDPMALLECCDDVMDTPMSDLLSFPKQYEYEKIEIVWLTK